MSLKRLPGVMYVVAWKVSCSARRDSLWKRQKEVRNLSVLSEEILVRLACVALGIMELAGVCCYGVKIHRVC